ncbi:tetraacyldisaccharide 4'-kinase [Bacteroidia bacterium]|nr:tetraacyldisaccharide 4'-kinase [Bacteroidia bacterium]GHV08766.1 tetraacyldisaccharide 4'-kinase [Bacteroidia bacterium]
MTANLNINKALLPFSWIYGAGVWVRNKLFDRGVLPSEEFPVPVISIGNIIVGGTGKTPHIEYLIRLLKKKYRVAVLSRGYKRKTSGFILAEKTSDSQTIGDEPFQMYRKFPDVLIAVGANRRRGIQNLLNLPEEIRPEIVLLDDAFQHRYVKPSLSILLTTYNYPVEKDCLLPAGKLRENPANKSRADIFIYTKCPSGLENISDKTGQTFYTSFRYKGLMPVFPKNCPVVKESIERLEKENYSLLLITGLANPDNMIRYVNNYTSDLQTLIYPDHHDFTEKDIRKICEIFSNIKNSQKIALTSEKDAMRLLRNPYVTELLKSHLFYLPIEVIFNFDSEELFINTIKDHVANFKRNRIMAQTENTRRNKNRNNTGNGLG